MSAPTASRRQVREIRAGFIPLIDCAPLVVAHALGLDAREGLTLRLQRETSWATVRDRIAVRHLDVAHMLAPMPVAANLGLTPLAAPLVAPIALGTGGNTITVARALWPLLAAHGAATDLAAMPAARALARTVAGRRQKGEPRLVIAVVHPHSAHRYQLAYWLGAVGLRPGTDVEIVVVPPPLMPAALAGGQIDAFCAGEPWGSVAAEQGAGVILTTNAHIWRASPEKVLGMRTDWAEADPERLAGLVRCVYRAALWCDDPGNRGELAAILARSENLDRPVAQIEASLARRLVSASGAAVDIPGFLNFAARAATFPWVSHALWFLAQMIRWGDASLTPAAIEAARCAYRPDLYRAALASVGATLPSANSKLEGGLAAATPVASPTGRLVLGPDRFFDGGVFDPERLADYAANFAVRTDATTA